MPQPLTIYGTTTCDDTERTRAWLDAWSVPYAVVDIDHDSDADAFVRVVNRGFRSTPTLVFGQDKRKVLLTEPDEAQLRAALAEAGFIPADPGSA